MPRKSRNMDKIKLTVDTTIKEFEKLEQALDRNDHRAVGAALYRVRSELDTLKTLVGDAGTVTKVQVVRPEDLDPQILSDVGAQLMANIESAEGDVTELVDEETLQDLDDDWDRAKRGGEAGHER
jgi:hypothetical protein